MTEELLHFIWKYRVFEPIDLKCADGTPIEVLDPGIHNTDAGPDFFNAKIKIGETLWAGNVEMHLKSSDWLAHHHHTDKNYNNVILHVVIENDLPAHTQSNRQVPVCEIATSPLLLKKYHRLYSEQKWLVCQDGISAVSNIEWANWLERCAIAKLELRTQKIEELLTAFNGDWDQTFFVMLARSFGFGTNAEPFEMMARQTPIKAILHHGDDLKQIEAILLGQSGLLGDVPKDAYHAQLLREYTFLKAKYNLSAVDAHLFKFLRLRPGNFPTIRMAQLAAFIAQSQGMWDIFLKCGEHSSVEKQLKTAPSSYWDTHYLLGEEHQQPSRKSIGAESVRLITINAIVPFVFAYGALRANETLKQKALGWLEELPPEKNKTIEKWANYAGIHPQNAFESQALIYLRKQLCEQKKCLQCRIGHAYLAKSPST
jgi:hypothetical protein